MSSNNIWKSDLWKLHNIVEGSFLSYPKEVFISFLRDYFSHDTYYRFLKNSFGFPNTADHTDLLPDAGINDNTTTRLYIGENYHQDIIFYPAIIIKANGAKYNPISINRDSGKVQYESIIYEDGYNSKTISRPAYFVTNGAYDTSITVEIQTRSLKARDELVELVSILFTEIAFESLVDIGIVVKPVSISSPSEADDRIDKLFKQSLTFDIRCEWRRSIPITTVIDTIMFIIEFADLNSPDPIVAPNLTIVTEVDLTTTILNL